MDEAPGASPDVTRDPKVWPQPQALQAWPVNSIFIVFLGES